jgi:hypothetical protein
MTVSVVFTWRKIMSLSILSIVFPNGDPPQEAYEAMMVDYVAHCEHYDAHMLECPIWRDNCAECIEREGRTHDIFWNHAAPYTTIELYEEYRDNDDLVAWVCEQIDEMMGEAKSVSLPDGMGLDDDQK